MAISAPTELYAQSLAAQLLTSTVACTLTAGTTAWLFYGGNVATAKQVSAVVDSLGNVWTVDFTFTGAGTNRCVAAVSSPITVGGSSTLTVTYNTATSGIAHIWVQSCTGVKASPYDSLTSNTNSQTAVAALSLGATSALAGVPEIGWTVVSIASNRVLTPSSGWVNATTGSLGSGAGANLMYQLAGATTGLSNTSSWTTNTNYSAGIVAYKGVPASGTPNLLLMGVG